jgi:hypothetical protein
MRSIDCAQRYARQFANLRLGFPVFPQQHHLYRKRPANRRSGVLCYYREIMRPFIGKLMRAHGREDAVAAM